MTDEDHHRKLERMYLAAPTNEYYRPVMRVGAAEAEVAIQVRPEFFHAASAVHGSVYFKLLDDAAFFAVASILPDVFPLTVGYTVHLTRPISAGEMRARGRVVHRGSRLYLAEAELVDGAGVPLGRGTGSFMPSRTPLSPEIGYR